MYYTATDLTERALLLSDLKNTDFLSHKELTDYINDAYQSTYQTIINNGDTVFIKQIKLNLSGSVEIDLPKDFYQMHSLKDRYTGQLFMRASASQGEWSNTYSIINDKLKLNNIAADDLVLSYYPMPTFISLPDEDINLDLNANIMSVSGNKALLSNGSIIDLLKKTTLGNISIVDNAVYALGNGFVTELINNKVVYLSFNGNALNSYDVTNAKLLNNGYYVSNKKIYFKDRQIEYEEDELPNNIYVNSDEDIIDLTEYSNIFNQISDFNGNKAYAYVKDDKPYFMTTDDEGNIIEDDQLGFKAFGYIAICDYGFICTDGTNLTIKSATPNTEMSFPNNIVYQIVAAKMALSFINKQNSTNEGLMIKYADLNKQYIKSLNQNASAVRIANVY